MIVELPPIPLLVPGVFAAQFWFAGADPKPGAVLHIFERLGKPGTKAH